MSFLRWRKSVELDGEKFYFSRMVTLLRDADITVPHCWDDLGMGRGVVHHFAVVGTTLSEPDSSFQLVLRLIHPARRYS